MKIAFLLCVGQPRLFLSPHPLAPSGCTIRRAGCVLQAVSQIKRQLPLHPSVPAPFGQCPFRIDKDFGTPAGQPRTGAVGNRNDVRRPGPPKDGLVRRGHAGIVGHGDGHVGPTFRRWKHLTDQPRQQTPERLAVQLQDPLSIVDLEFHFPDT